MTELDSEKFVLEKHRETLEHELKELKAQHEQMLSNMSMQAPTSHDNIETISPAADVPSDLERKVGVFNIRFCNVKLVYSFWISKLPSTSARVLSVPCVRKSKPEMLP